MIIRPFIPGNLDMLWELHILAVLHAGFSAEVAGWDTDLYAIATSFACFLVAVSDDGQLIGMGGYVVTNADSVELKRMRVHPAHQKSGVGTQLLLALENTALTAKFKRAHLDTANSAARSFYERNGYTFVKTETDGGYEFYFYSKYLS